MLLASLSSCCNPCIYMFFSGRPLQDAARCLALWGCPKSAPRRQGSAGSLCSRRTTILSHGLSAGIPLHRGSGTNLSPLEEEVVTDSGTL